MLAVLGGKGDDILHAHVIPRLDAESIIAFGKAKGLPCSLLSFGDVACSASGSPVCRRVSAAGATCTQIRTITLTDAVARLPAWKQIPFLTANFRTRSHPDPQCHRPSGISLLKRFEWEDPRIGHMDVVWGPVPAADPPRLSKTINWPDDAKITPKAQAIEVAVMMAEYWRAMHTKIETELSLAAGDALGGPGWDTSLRGYFQSMVRIAQTSSYSNEASHACGSHTSLTIVNGLSTAGGQRAQHARPC
jgi:hypothetical protein